MQPEIAHMARNAQISNANDGAAPVPSGMEKDARVDQ
jgi:hypothetical protein